MAEGRDPDEMVFVGGEWLTARRVLEELKGSTSVLNHLACENLGLERGTTYGEAAEAVVADWRQDGLVA